MKMNRIETWMMNNPIRTWIQKHYASPRLIALGGVMQGGRALEIGCGRGEGLKIILDDFGADEAVGLDLDVNMVEKANRRLAGYQGRARVELGSADGIEAEDASYDAVFGFGIIHHIPDWRASLHEVRRVLKPGGVFYSEESFIAFINHPFWVRVLEHPREDRFTPTEYCEGLRQAGFEVLGKDIMKGDWSGWVVARKS